MRLPYNGNYGTTQGFNDACCRGAYAKFGMIGHNGIDYGLPCGTEIVAPISGSVSYFWDPGGYGNAVFIRGEGVEVVLAHLQNVYVSSGNVSAGQVIGRSGTTGNSTGCHLHFGVRPYPGYNSGNGFFGYVDPQPYLNKGGENMPTLADRKIVDGIYMTVLGRPANDEDAKSWVGMPVDKVFWDIANSPERGNFVRDRIKSFYGGFLGRADKDISKGEIDGWYNQPERVQISGIKDSNEAVQFRARAAALATALAENAELKKKLAEASGGGIDQQTKDDIGFIKSTVQWIKDKLSSIFK